MTKKKITRRRFTTEQKTAILRRHLVDKVAVSDLCEEYALQPSVFYSWQKLLFDNMEAAFSGSDSKQEAARERELQREVEKLQAKLARKDEVIAEVVADQVALKKELGEA